ncbi:MAG: NUDIX domain-containing protein [Bacteroidota bacterium]
MVNYVCGFYFDHTLARVVLIWKEKPKWQAGKLNGVGGKIEACESPLLAMRREFNEECGIDHEEWNDLIVIAGHDWQVYFFYATGKANEFEYAETQETEEIAKIDIDKLDDYPHISNLRWLIPMALYKMKFPEEDISFYSPELNPLKGERINTMLHDPNAPKVAEQEAAGEAANAEATNEQATEGTQESAEEGNTEG